MDELLRNLWLVSRAGLRAPSELRSARTNP